MLIQFRFKNYKSFKDEVILDLTSERVLPVAAIYGANGSGKSNVYKAFEFMTHFVNKSFEYGDDIRLYAEIKPRPFLFDETSGYEDTRFEVSFTVPEDSAENIYNYGFCLGDEGVTEEWLIAKTKNAKKDTTVFYRDTENIELLGIPKASRDNILRALEKQVLIASLGAKLKVEKCKIVRDWFLKNEFTDCGEFRSKYFSTKELPEGFVEHNSVREDVVRFLTSLDCHIEGFKIRKIPELEHSKENKIILEMLHKKCNSVEVVSIPMEEESAGVLKVFSLYPKLQKVLQEGSVLFVDELDARLHPLVVRNLVIMFKDPQVNKNHAQLIFTTHDTWQMENQLLHQDEIWFTEKSREGGSSLYSLNDFVEEINSDQQRIGRYQMDYLTGRYGAIPTLNSICRS